MELIKTNEKILIWMHRNNLTQSALAEKLNISRQALSQKMRDNIFAVGDMIKLKALGFD